MPPFLAVGLGLISWLLLSHVYPDWKFLSRILFHHVFDSDDGVITPSLARFIEETIARENITGLSVSVVPKHGEPEIRTWGYRTEDRDDMTPDTLVYIGSLSKAFCVTAIGLLIDDFEHGRNVTALPSGLDELTWRTRLKDLLPDWQLMDEWATERTNLHDILSHVSGVSRHDFSYGPEDTPEDLLKSVRYLKPAFELREQFSYNNIMYMIAAHVVATYAGQSYTSFVEERIFQPLGMTASTFSLEKAKASNRLSQGWTEGGRRLPDWFTEGMTFLIAGPGGVISSAIDMSRWILAWLGEGTCGDQVVFPLSVYKNASYAYTVTTSHPMDSDNSIAGYGMGWARSSYRGHDVVFHTGGVPGFSTVLAFLPNDEIGVSVFANGLPKSVALQTVFYRVLDQVLGLPTGHEHELKRPATPPDANSDESVHPKHDADVNMTPRLDDLAGTYAQPGYGNLTLCSPSSLSPYCTRVRSEFARVDQNNGGEDLLAAWPRMWSSHVRVRHHSNDADGRTFDMYFTSLFPEGCGKDTTPFEWGLGDEVSATAEFVVREDGRVGGFWMREGGMEVEAPGEITEVWFARV